MSTPDPLLAAAEALLDEEFNQGAVEDPPQLDVEPAAAPVEPETPSLTVDATGRTHGPDGKFVAASDEETVEETEEVEEPVSEPEEEGQPEGTPEGEVETDDLVFELDPEIESVLEKYDGDLNKALRALNEGQSLIGRQGSELGELRTQMQELVTLVQQNQFNPMLYAPYKNSVDEEPGALVGEVLQRAAESGNFDEATYERALAAWAEEEPFPAARLDAQVAMARQMAQQAAPQPGAEDLAKEVDAFKERNPDFQQLLPTVNELVEQRPLLKRSLYEGTAQERVQALDDLYSLAKSRTTQSDTSAAAKKVILRAKADADKAKGDAAVVGASRTSAVDTEPKGNALLQQALRDLSGLDDLVIE